MIQLNTHLSPLQRDQSETSAPIERAFNLTELTKFPELLAIFDRTLINTRYQKTESDIKLIAPTRFQILSLKRVEKSLVTLFQETNLSFEVRPLPQVAN